MSPGLTLFGILQIAQFRSRPHRSDQDKFLERTNSYLEQHRILTDRLSDLENEKRDQKSRAVVIDGFVNGLIKRPLVVDEFDEQLWMAAI